MFELGLAVFVVCIIFFIINKMLSIPKPTELGKLLGKVIEEGNVDYDGSYWYYVLYDNEKYSFAISSRIREVHAVMVKKLSTSIPYHTYKLDSCDRLYLYSVIEKKRKEHQDKVLQELREKVEK